MNFDLLIGLSEEDINKYYETELMNTDDNILAECLCNGRFFGAWDFGYCAFLSSRGLCNSNSCRRWCGSGWGGYYVKCFYSVGSITYSYC